MAMRCPFSQQKSNPQPGFSLSVSHFGPQISVSFFDRTHCGCACKPSAEQPAPILPTRLSARHRLYGKAASKKQKTCKPPTHALTASRWRQLSSGIGLIFGPAGLYRRHSERLTMTHGTLLKHDAAIGAPPFETLPDSGSACLSLLLGMFVKQKVFERIRLRGGHPTGSEMTANGQSWAARRACFVTEFLARPGVVGSFFFFFFFSFFLLPCQSAFPLQPCCAAGMGGSAANGSEASLAPHRPSKCAEANTGMSKKRSTSQQTSSRATRGKWSEKEASCICTANVTASPGPFSASAHNNLSLTLRRSWRNDCADVSLESQLAFFTCLPGSPLTVAPIPQSGRLSPSARLIPHDHHKLRVAQWSNLQCKAVFSLDAV
ncbi:hypothetical protein IWX46DRAFT_70733 [Phyllosticta citricarpa]